ncbi:CHAP domain-containing protein [Streptomyces sp. NBC_01485]|uniref:CHAP domain-containing protein n=1 Tax=Streptomyces sp. NBC_01485 TaxID=2903884 RepID=UPI002E312E9C|nr:CHAP domain-containing protein [Streptomyces sp. NBC_01485]
MTGTAGDVIRIAKSQVGYHEGYSGGHWTNLQKYSPAVPGLEWSQNQAWCATFAAWCFQEAGMPKGSYPVTASCALGVSWWENAGRFSDYPGIGAQVFFGSGGGSHTGLVYAYDADFIYTAEGNTNSSGSAEGDGVYLKKRARRDTYVYGYGYPSYPTGIVTADPAWKNPTAPSQQEEAVALTDDDIKKIGRQVVTGANGAKSPDDPTVEWAMSSFLGLTYKTARTIAADVAAVKAKVESLSVGGVDLDALAEKVADKLAARLAE